MITINIDQAKDITKQRLRAERDLIPYYINSTPQGVFSFDLMDLPEPVWFNHQMPASTEFDRVDKVEKLVGYLPIDEAVQL